MASEAGNEKKGEGNLVSFENQAERETYETAFSLKDESHREFIILMMKKMMDDEGMSGRFALEFVPGEAACKLSIQQIKNDTHTIQRAADIEDITYLCSPQLPHEESTFNSCARVLIDATAPTYSKVLAAKYLVQSFQNFLPNWSRHPALVHAAFRCCKTSLRPLLEPSLTLVRYVASASAIQPVEVTPEAIQPLVAALGDVIGPATDSVLIGLYQLALRSDNNRQSIAEYIEQLISFLGNTKMSKLVTLILFELCKIHGIFERAVAINPDIPDIIRLASDPTSVSEESFLCCARVLISETDAVHSKSVAAGFISKNLKQCLAYWNVQPHLAAALFRCLSNSYTPLLQNVVELISLIASKGLTDEVELTAASFLPIVEALQGENQKIRDDAAYVLLRLAKRSESNKVFIGEYLQSLVNLLGRNRLAKLSALILTEVCQVRINLERSVSCNLLPAIESGGVTQQFSIWTSGFPLPLVLLCTTQIGASEAITSPSFDDFINAVGRFMCKSTWDLCLLAMENLWFAFRLTLDLRSKRKIRGVVSKIVGEATGQTQLEAQRLISKMK